MEAWYNGGNSEAVVGGLVHQYRGPLKNCRLCIEPVNRRIGIWFAN